MAFRCYSFVVPAVKTQLEKYFGDKWVFQAPSANNSTVLIGDATNQLYELGAGANTPVLDIKELSEVYIKGNGSDKITILLMHE